MSEWLLDGQALQRADTLHRKATIVDMLLSTNFSRSSPVLGPGDTLDRAIESGISGASQTLVGSTNRSFRDALKEVNTMSRLLEAKPDQVLIVNRVEDIARAKAENKMGLIMAFQGADPLEDDWLNTLPVFARLGIKIMALTYNEQGLLGSGCLEPNDGGLTAYGKQVVGAMNSYGIIIDLSHVGMKTSLDAVEASRHPVLATHSNVRALTPHPRNLTDDVIEAIAEKGGVIGVVAWEPLCVKSPDAKGSLSDMLDNVDYLVKLTSVDNVGLGSDINENFRAMPIRSDFESKYSWMIRPGETAPGIEGYSWVHEIRNVTRGLIARGYTDEDIIKILGGNFLRVAGQVWNDRRAWGGQSGPA